MNPEPAPNEYWESQVAERLGLSRSALRKLRKEHLREGEHWHLLGNAVVLTGAGMAQVQTVLAAVHPDGDLPATGKGGAASANVVAGPPPRRRAMVWAVPRFRKDQTALKILHCREVDSQQSAVRSWDLSKVKATSEIFAARVSNAVNFMPGMVLELVWAGQCGWQYLGRLPRRPGQW